MSRRWNKKFGYCIWCNDIRLIESRKCI